MTAPYRTARSELRRAETDWRHAPRSIDIDEELDRLPRWLCAAIIMTAGTVFWAGIFWLGLTLGPLIP